MSTPKSGTFYRSVLVVNDPPQPHHHVPAMDEKGYVNMLYYGGDGLFYTMDFLVGQTPFGMEKPYWLKQESI